MKTKKMGILALTFLLFLMSKTAYCQNIFLSEIFPNPKGVDSGKEWLEICNDSGTDVDLTGWIVDTGIKKKNPLDGNIEKLSCVIPTLRVALKNTKAKISLISDTGKIIDSVEYATSEEAKSFSKIKIMENVAVKETISIWTNPSKGKPNPNYYKMTGTVEKLTTDGKSLFIILKTKTETIKIQIPPEIKEPRAKVLFRKKTKLSIVGEKSNNFLRLKNFEVFIVSKDNMW